MKTIRLDGQLYKLTLIEEETAQKHNDCENKCDGCKHSEKEVYNDWRLPTIRELLVNYDKYSPASDLEDTISVYWSSSTYAPLTYLAWGVYMGNGYDYAYAKTSSFYVRCVRNGEKGLEWSESSIIKMTWYEAIDYAKHLEVPVYYKGE